MSEEENDKSENRVNRFDRSGSTLTSKETANLLKGGDAKSQTYRVRVYEYPACTPRWLDRLLLSKNQVTHQ